MQQHWNEPPTATIYLANGEQARANVNGISLADGSGHAMVHLREIRVMPLPSPWYGEWAEVITIMRPDGSAFETVLNPIQLQDQTAIIDHGEETLYLLCDQGSWREMTGQELERERRAWEEDMKDLAQIAREWREYRNEGLGERG